MCGELGALGAATGLVGNANYIPPILGIFEPIFSFALFSFTCPTLFSLGYARLDNRLTFWSGAFHAWFRRRYCPLGVPRIVKLPDP